MHRELKAWIQTRVSTAGEAGPELLGGFRPGKCWGHFYGAAAQQVDTRCKPGEELQNHVQITSNMIKLHWLDAEKKDQIAAMHMFFMLLSSVIVVCSSIEFPVSEFLEFQNVGVGLGRSTTPSTGLWTLGALSRVMWFHCESWTSLIQGNLIPTASRVCADESFHKASLADSCVVRQN